MRLRFSKKKKNTFFQWFLREKLTTLRESTGVGWRKIRRGKPECTKVERERKDEED